MSQRSIAAYAAATPIPYTKWYERSSAMLDGDISHTGGASFMAGSCTRLAPHTAVPKARPCRPEPRDSEDWTMP